MAFDATKITGVNAVTGGISKAPAIYSVRYTGTSTDLTADTAALLAWGTEVGIGSGDFIFAICSDKSVAGATTIAASKMKITVFTTA